MQQRDGKLRHELLNGEIFDTLWEAKVLTESWRSEYNQKRPHSPGKISGILRYGLDFKSLRL